MLTLIGEMNSCTGGFRCCQPFFNYLKICKCHRYVFITAITMFILHSKASISFPYIRSMNRIKNRCQQLFHSMQIPLKGINSHLVKKHSNFIWFYVDSRRGHLKSDSFLVTIHNDLKKEKITAQHTKLDN